MNQTNSEAFYIGANDIVQEGHWVWASSGQVANYVNWGPSQPNNRWGNENCAVLRYLPSQNFTYRWTDDPCSDRYNYICKMTYANIHILG